LSTVLHPADEQQAARSSSPFRDRAVVGVRLAFLFIAAILGFLQAWASRQTIVNDTVSYLDIGDWIWQRHWSAAVNGVWSPLYAAILGIVNGLVHPSPRWEYPLVHLVLFVIFLFTFACYDFFLLQLLQLRRTLESAGSDASSLPALLSIGYVLFLWASLRLVGVDETNPDMLVAAFFYAACGLLILIHRRHGGWLPFLALGVVLGLGFLTKSIFFPVSLLCLAAVAVIARARPKEVLASSAIFVAICAPWIAALSHSRGHLTFSDSGPYNYAVHVDNLPPADWQGGPGSLYGQPLHPTRLLVQSPATFAFTDGLGGTDPAWTDPSYWYEGVHPRFRLGLAIRSLSKHSLDEVGSLFSVNGSLIASVWILFWASGRRSLLLRDIARFWFLLLPSVAALAIYAMVHFEPRYLAPFLSTLLLVLLLSPRMAAGDLSRRLVTAVAGLLIFMFFVPIGSPSLHVKEFVRDVAGRSHPDPNAPAAVAEAMAHLGLRPGDRIAALQWAICDTSTWARLARVQIAGEVYFWPTRPESLGNDFWKADPQSQQAVIRAFSTTGARFIISRFPPPGGQATGWERVGASDYYAYALAAPQLASSKF
jgi:4-amino-4-deoxy-L-arabinose transferase-like glycosyltransferase